MRLVLGSPSNVVVRGLASLLGDVPEAEVVGASSTQQGLLRLLLDQRPDAVLLEASMMTSLREGLNLHRPRVLVFGRQPHVGTRSSFGTQSACGYTHIDGEPDAIVSAIRTVALCGVVHPGHERCAGCPVRQTLRAPQLPLSARETDVFVRIGWMQGNAEIAQALGIKVKTVEAHREAIKRKLALPTAAALLEGAVAWRSGRLPAHDARRHAPDAGKPERRSAPGNKAPPRNTK